VQRIKRKVVLSPACVLACLFWCAGRCEVMLTSSTQITNSSRTSSSQHYRYTLLPAAAVISRLEHTHRHPDPKSPRGRRTLASPPDMSHDSYVTWQGNWKVNRPYLSSARKPRARIPSTAPRGKASTPSLSSKQSASAQESHTRFPGRLVVRLRRPE
jgi:hypothetical protein